MGTSGKGEFFFQRVITIVIEKTPGVQVVVAVEFIVKGK